MKILILGSESLALSQILYLCGILKNREVGQRGKGYRRCLGCSAREQLFIICGYQQLQKNRPGYLRIQGLPRWHSGKEFTCQCRKCQRHRFDPWVWIIPWRRKWQPTPVFLLGKFHGQRSLAGYSPWGYEVSETTE